MVSGPGTPLELPIRALHVEIRNLDNAPVEGPGRKYRSLAVWWTGEISNTTLIVRHRDWLKASAGI